MLGITDANGNSSVKAYNDPNNPLSPTSITTKDGETTSCTYDKFGNQLTVSDPRGNITTYTYDYSTFYFGRLIKTQVGNLTPTVYTFYEPYGLVNTKTSAKPGSRTGEVVTTSFTYDVLGNILTMTKPGNNAASTQTTRYDYTTDDGYTQAAAVGKPLAIIDALNRINHYRYYANGSLARVTDPMGDETDYIYNLAGQNQEVRSPATSKGGLGYIRVVSNYLYTGGPLTQVSTYDEAGSLVRQNDEVFGLEGELLNKKTGADSLSFTYDSLNNPLTVTDGRGQKTIYSYDSVGRVTSIQSPKGERIQFTSYDAADHFLSIVDGNGVQTTYEYNDPSGKPTKMHFPASPNLDVQYTYDNYGHRVGMTDSTGSMIFTHDQLGNLLSTTTQYTGLPARTISYTYYNDGSRASMEVPSATGTGSFTYSYDEAGQLIQMKNPQGKTSGWSYQQDGRILKQTMGNHAWTSFDYDAKGRLINKTNHAPKGRILSEFTNLTYDGAGNLLNLRAIVPGLQFLSGTTNYTYDSNGQLLQESSTRGVGYTRNYSYDSAGNPTQFGGIAHSSANADNQLTDAGFCYDQNGNPTVYNGNLLSFDPENRLEEYRNQANQVLMSAAYNGFGLRTSKGSASGIRYFLYDGTIPICELDGNGNTVALMTWRGNKLLARNNTWYAFDNFGNIMHRLNSKGNVSSSDLYDAWGNLISGGDSSDPYGYDAEAGYYTDHETGLQFLTYRYYDPSLGRFITPDRIGVAAEANLYRYADNDSTILNDPLGLFNLAKEQCCMKDALNVAKWTFGLKLTMELAIAAPPCLAAASEAAGVLHHGTICCDSSCCRRSC